MEQMKQRYSNPVINRQYWLADALIFVKSYEWKDVDVVAAELSDADVEAFHRVVMALENKRNAAR